MLKMIITEKKIDEVNKNFQSGEYDSLIFAAMVYLGVLVINYFT